MNHTYCLTKFAVITNSDYVELKDENKFTRQVVNFGPDNKLFNAKFKDPIVYNPLEDTKELYMEMNKIDFKSPATFTKFINTYGLPLGDNISAGNEEVKVFYKMDIKEFLEPFIRIKEIIDLWQAIQENNLDKLKKAKESFGLSSGKRFLIMAEVYKQEILKTDIDIKELFKKEGSFTSEELKLWESVKDGDLKDIAKAYITVLLNKQSFGTIKTTLVDVPCPGKGKTVMKKKIVDAVSFENLFEVAFYQLRQMIFNEMQIRTCEHCGFPFEVTHEKQRFCPPLFGKKRSNCENTYNQRLRRQKKKEQQSQ